MSMSSDIKNYHGVVEITTEPNGKPINVTIHKNGETLTSKEAVWNYFKEKGFSDEEIAGLYGNLAINQLDKKEDTNENHI